MTLFKTIAATALTGLAALGFAGASLATPTQRPIVEGSAKAHIALVAAIQRNGVRVAINHPYCGEREGANGFYISRKRLLVVCQDNGVPGGPLVQWTANDLDTLRHEAQHFIQDCVVGTNHDALLQPVYRSPSALAVDVLGQDSIDNITRIYRQNGADDHVLTLEHEAFAVATLNVPAEQAKDIDTYCGG